MTARLENPTEWLEQLLARRSAGGEPLDPGALNIGWQKLSAHIASGGELPAQWLRKQSDRRERFALAMASGVLAANPDMTTDWLVLRMVETADALMVALSEVAP